MKGAGAPHRTGDWGASASPGPTALSSDAVLHPLAAPPEQGGRYSPGLPNSGGADDMALELASLSTVARALVARSSPPSAEDGANAARSDAASAAEVSSCAAPAW